MDYRSVRSAWSDDEVSQNFQMSEPRSTHARNSSASVPNTPYDGGYEGHEWHEGRDSQLDSEPLWGTQQHDSRPYAKPLSYVRAIGVQVLALLWLAPIFTLLYLNFSKRILGASAWCPFHQCYPDVWDYNGTQATISANQVRLDRNTHNFLGYLQIISKALEIWFILIATWLVYLVTMHLAGQPEGIPIGYLTRPSEFAELPGLFDILLWKTVRRLPSSQHRARRRLWLFLVTTIALCIVCNLMGPAIAVLLLPTLQWTQTGNANLERFTTFNSDSPISASGASFNQSFWRSCTKDQVTAQNYECNHDGAAALDSWVEASMSFQATPYWMTVQDSINLTFNNTNETCDNGALPLLVQWVPSRQMIEKLNGDLLTIMNISNGARAWDEDSAKRFDSFKLFNSTIQSFVQRKGPILGAVIGTWVDFDNQDHWTTVVDESRSVICYRSYNDSNVPLCLDCGDNKNYTRCISVGDGWDDGSKSANFTVHGNFYDNLGYSAPDLYVNVHTSHRVAWLVESQLPSGVSPDCIVNGTAPSDCDWDTFFNSSEASKKLRSGPATTIEISREMAAPPGMSSLQSFAIDFTAYQRFATYSLDTSWLTNMYIVASFQVGSPCFYNAIPVDPTWVAAAWAANVSGYMPSSRSLTFRLENAMDGYWSPLLYDPQDVVAVSLMPVLQTLSLIDHESSAVSDNYKMTNVDQDPNSNATLPILYRWGRLNVYTYGFWTRSSYFGCIVTMIGCVVVLIEVCMGIFVDRRKFTSPTQLVVAALEHQYRDEFRGARGQEKVVWRTRFRVREDGTKVGALGFEKTV